MLIRFIRRKLIKRVAIPMVLLMLLECGMPFYSFALTSGPTTPEVASFEPATTTDLVDPFTGDFTYNINLFELPGPNGGYPFNLAYHAGNGMETEATWAGLGWNVNPGAINRSVRGLADDYKGDKVITTGSQASNWTVGGSIGGGAEVLGGDLGIGVNFGIYYNYFRGLGYNTSVSLSAQYSKANSDKVTGGMGVNLSVGFDSQEGFSFSPSISASIKSGNSAKKSLNGSVGVGVTISSSRGMTDMNFTNSISGSKRGNATRNTDASKAKQDAAKVSGSGGLSGGAPISFASTAFSPTFEDETRGSNLRLSFKLGSQIVGFNPYLTFAGYYNEQHMRYDDEPINTAAYGYMYLQDAVGVDNSLMDFTREKDGIIRPETPNLPIPSLTYDIYTIAGQGVGASFRPYRSDIGTVYDKTANSFSFGGTLSGDFAGGTVAKFGFDINLNGSTTTSERWQQNNNNYKLNFTGKNTNLPVDYEPVYFAVSGEPTADYWGQYSGVGDEKAVALQLSGSAPNNNVNTGAYYFDKNNRGYSPTTFSGTKTTAIRPTAMAEYNNSIRKPRIGTILPFTNRELRYNDFSNTTSDYVLKEFNIFYHDKTASSFSGFPVTDQEKTSPVAGAGYGSVSTLRENAAYQEHIGGYSTIDGNGSRYIYGLPVYNLKQVDEVQSVTVGGTYATAMQTKKVDISSWDIEEDYDAKTTEKYRKRKELPAYATSHMLTSILGSDYVDVDNNGPSDNDLGYWVKFNYVKTAGTSSAFKWRTPYSSDKANFIQGYRSKGEDDKLSYTYGEKEVYYLASAETKTHIAVFHLSPRQDGLGTSSESDGYAINSCKKSYKLDQIKLYAKNDYYTAGAVNSSAVPIQVVHFTYDYSLCQGVENTNSTTAGQTGKLTLKEVAFTYQNSNRGKLNPYKFTYNNNPGKVTYNGQMQDRWGNLKMYKCGANGDDYDFPYVPQTNADVTALGSCKLSSGTDIKQELIAQVSEWNIKTITTPSGTVISPYYEPDDYGYVQHRVASQMFKIAGFTNLTSGTFGIGSNTLYSGTTAYSNVIFKLEKPISTLNELKRYFEDVPTPDGRKQIYVKALSCLRTTNESDYKEYVSGYLDYSGFGFYGNVNGSNQYEYAYVTLSQAHVGNHNINGHPISALAWNFLRSSLPELALSSGSLASGGPGSTGASKKNKAKQLTSFFTKVGDLFRGYYNSCRQKNWAQTIDIDHSVIRLNTPDKIKYGGDLRVSKVTINDSWTFDGAPPVEYGVVYDYTKQETDANGQVMTISSGVAQYETSVGEDENSLRYAKRYSIAVPMHADDEFMMEYPLNESYYPGAQVGYSQVTIKSLATQKQLENLGSSGIAEYKNLIGTGIAVHEFYTAREFPVLTDETSLRNNNPATDGQAMQRVRVTAPIPLIGYVTVDDMSATQGYMIELNNMHGKEKKTTYYPQDKNGNVLTGQPVSSVEYKYCMEQHVLDGKQVYRLKNDGITVLTGEGVSVSRTVGVEQEIFNDLRRSSTITSNGGVAVNLEVLYFGLPILLPPIWPSIGYSENIVNLAVTNKIVRKAGIVKEVIASDGMSVVSTKNEMYDALTGRPLLTTVKNNFDDLVYEYKMPARWFYPPMGPAFVNAGMSIDIGIDAGSSLGCSPKLCGLEEVSRAPQPTNTSYSYAKNYRLQPKDVNATFFDKFVEGDELLITCNNNPSLTPFHGVVVQRVKAYGGFNPYMIVSLPCNLGSSGCASFSNYNCYNLKVVRSGARNILNTDAGQIQSLSNPLNGRQSITCAIDAPAPDDINFTCEDFKTLYKNLFEIYAGRFNTATASFYDYEVKAGNSWTELLAGITGATGDLNFTSIKLNCPNNPYPDGPRPATGATGGTGATGATGSNPGFGFLFGGGVALGDDGGSGGSTGATGASGGTGGTGSTGGTGTTSTEVIWETGSGHPFDCHFEFYRGSQLLNCQLPFINLKCFYTTAAPVLPPGSTGCTGCTGDPVIIENCPSKIEFIEFVPNASGDEVSARVRVKYRCVENCFGDYSEFYSEEIRIIAVPCPPACLFQPAASSCEKISMKKINNVLNSSATTFTDSWNFNFNQVQSESVFRRLNSLSRVNPFGTGEKGIWRPRASYTYVEDRKQTSTTVNTRVDGTYDQMPIFVWDNPLVYGCSNFTKWRKTNTITGYSPYNYEIENKNILNIYSSALYGYRGKANIALSSNTSSQAMGTEDFEDYIDAGLGNQFTAQTGNLTIVPHVTTDTVYDNYEVLAAIGNMAIINKPWDGSDNFENVKIAAMCAPNYPDWKNETTLSYCHVSTRQETSGADAAKYPGLTKITLTRPAITSSFGIGSNGAGFSTNDDYRCWTGTIHIPRHRNNSTVNDNIMSYEFVKKAHTGKVCLRLPYTDGCVFPQMRLKLQHDLDNSKDKYVVSAWLSESSMDQPTYADGLDQPFMRVTFHDKTGAVISHSNKIYPSGTMVEGWQKVEAILPLPLGADYITLKMGSDDGNAIVYWDDIRVCPFLSNMKTYVYDKTTFRLAAVLDENNYATIYSYNESGNLYLIKKETPRGVETIKEAREHNKEQ